MAPVAASGAKRSRTDIGNGATRNASVSPPPIKRRQQSSVTQKAVANFFKPASEKEVLIEKISWKIHNDTLLTADYLPQDSAAVLGKDRSKKQLKIAAFDFDSTLIQPASGLKHSRDANDWKWWDPSIPATLKRLHNEGYTLVILTNQGGISLPTSQGPMSKTAKSDGKRYNNFKRKVTAALTQLDLPMRLYGATERDIFRKPRAGMWCKLKEDLESEDKSISIDMKNSFFVGDAAGRIAGNKVAKDFSCSDRDLAANIGITFHTPEEYFLQEQPRAFERSFEPKEFLKSLEGKSPVAFTAGSSPEIVLSCGSPGAGKSSFYWRHLQSHGYERVNQDILKSRDRCVSVATDLLNEGKSVSVDNTNAEPSVRAVWIKLARSFNIPIRCVYFTAPARLCEHNDAVRALNADMESLNREKRTILPAVAFYGYAKRFNPPTLEEGFADITNVDFFFEGSEGDKEIWSKYWT